MCSQACIKYMIDICLSASDGLREREERERERETARAREDIERLTRKAQSHKVFANGIADLWMR